MKPNATPVLAYGRQSISEADVAAVVEVLKGDFLTTGPMVDTLEKGFAEMVGAEHAVACVNGTAALHLASIALGHGSGHQVVVPSLTFLASANAHRFQNADIVFADVDPDTGLLTETTFREAIERASGPIHSVTVVHLNGQTADMQAIASVAAEHDIAVIEDGCHALGTRVWGNGMVGDCRLSDLAVFSLHPVKAITSGEGGVVTTNSAALAARLSQARNHGMVRDPDRFVDPDAASDGQGEPDPWYYEMQSLGYNYRLSDLHCALGHSQLDRLSDFAGHRRELMRYYDEALAGLAPLVRPVPRVPDCVPALHLYAVLIDFESAPMGRGELVRALRRRGIGTQVHYYPVHRQPYYRELYGELVLPGADRYYERVLSLPFHVGIGHADADRVVNSLREELGL